MKKAALVIVLVASLGYAFMPKGVVGKMFPYLQGENYNGKKVNLPNDTKGKYTLLGMAFSNKAEDDLKTWINPVYNKFILKVDRSKADVFDAGVDHDVNLYFIPMFTGLNQLTSKSSKENIKKNTDKQMYDYLLFYEGDKTYKDELDFEKKDIPYFFVLDKTGKIAYATSGKYDDSKMEAILDVVEENN
ncbi:MAG: hypothetical protein J0L87_10530 [Bacteroidetes bacterium]|nr:hypothetical protein [Bacteroidota bacterium]